MEFDVIDRLSLEIMKGFGSVPKRGAEVGGVLLGSVEEEEGRPVVHVRDFTAVTCDYATGPSYIHAEAGRETFRAAVQERSRGAGEQDYAVGYYRSHTREGIQLGAEDLLLLEECFPEEGAIALVVKPYATKVSQAGLFVRGKGGFRMGPSAPEVPVRRKELGGGSSVTERQASAARFGQASAGEAANPYLNARPAAAAEGVEVAAPSFGMAPVEEKKGKGIRSGWVWIPLSFIFMLLGVVLGFQTALSMRPKQPANPYLEAWDLSLTVKKTDNQLHVNWDPLAPAVRNATRGVLHIESREETRAIDLNASQLRAGSLIYKTVPERVLLRLDVFPRERATVTETVEYRAGN